jgi:hypothetical protein
MQMSLQLHQSSLPQHLVKEAQAGLLNLVKEVLQLLLEVNKVQAECLAWIVLQLLAPPVRGEIQVLEDLLVLVVLAALDSIFMISKESPVITGLSCFLC